MKQGHLVLPNPYMQNNAACNVNIAEGLFMPLKRYLLDSDGVGFVSLDL
jgi:hypothetical protein